MNNYLVNFESGSSEHISASGFTTMGETVQFFIYNGIHRPDDGMYGQCVYTHLFRLKDILTVRLIDDPVTI